MDQQQVIATVCFIIISSIMIYAFFQTEKAIHIIKKVYGFFGIKLDFSEGGKRFVRGIFMLLAILFLVASIAIVFFE